MIKTPETPTEEIQIESENDKMKTESVVANIPCDLTIHNAVPILNYADKSFETDVCELKDIDGSSTASEKSWYDFSFEANNDEYRFTAMCQILTVLTYALTFGACTNFYSSFYPVSLTNTTLVYVNVDSLLMATNIMCIDISSAIFIVSGFLATYMFYNMKIDDFKELTKVLCIYIFIDLWLSTLCCVILGSIFHYLYGTFHVRNILLTLLEGITGLHIFSWSQMISSWHSMNPTSWPIGVLMYSMLLMRCTIHANAQIRQCQNTIGSVLVIANAILPIFLLSLFALLREDSNIFFANATSVGYRLLEFNLGIACFNILQHRSAFFITLLHLLHQASILIFFGFIIVWFSEVGVPVKPAEKTCIRMYSFSPCIKAHHGFLMRGCLLGLTMLSRTVANESTKRPSSIEFLSFGNSPRYIAPLVTVILFTWPCCYLISLLLHINFSKSMIYENSSLLLIITPNIIFLFAYVWNTKVKRKIFFVFESVIDTITMKVMHKFSGTIPF